MSKVLLDRDLVIDLIRYHLGDVRGDGLEERIYKGLEAKLSAMAEHDRYSKTLADKNFHGREQRS